jgi:hypothetical protein
MALKNSSSVPAFVPSNLRLVMPHQCQLDVSNYFTIPEIILSRRKIGVSFVGALGLERSSKHLLRQSQKVAPTTRIITTFAQTYFYFLSQEQNSGCVTLLFGVLENVPEYE